MSDLYRLADAPCRRHRRDTDVTRDRYGRSRPFCEAAGFEVEQYDDGFAFVHFNDQSVFDLDLTAELDPATNHAGCYVIIDEVDEWHTRFVAAGLRVTPVEDMPWGMHEFTLIDPSGNSVRIGRSMADG
jgi:hypothetical protein